jgi:hypothetical protein
VLVHDRDVPLAELAAHKAALVADGSRVRLEQRTKNLKALLERAAADGYTSFATVAAGQAPPTSRSSRSAEPSRRPPRSRHLPRTTLHVRTTLPANGPPRRSNSPTRRSTTRRQAPPCGRASAT